MPWNMRNPLGSSRSWSQCMRAGPSVTPLNLPANVRKILKYWVGNDDGEAGRRAYDAIRHEVTRN